jgi:hypothetical protein
MMSYAKYFPDTVVSIEMSLADWEKVRVSILQALDNGALVAGPYYRITNELLEWQ